MKKIIIITIASILLSFNGFSQFISIVNNKFCVNGNLSCPIYFNGANNPWNSWNDFGGNYNVAQWDNDMINLKANGINAARIWFSCDGAGQPTISGTGAVNAPSAQFWQNCDSLFASAKRNGIYIMATMMSFDQTKIGNPNATNWQQMLNSQANVTTYVNNYIVPFVNRYKTNPYFWSVDICNEIEWIYENGTGGGDGTNWKGATYPILQRFVAMCAAGIHNNPRTDGTSVLVTVGSACVKWNGSIEVLETSTGPGITKVNPDGNKWSDVALKAQYNQANAVLDFYSPHYYGWMEQYYSSQFENTPAAFGMNEKPCLVGEMPAKSPITTDFSAYPTATMTIATAFNNLLAKGWQGHFPWTANLQNNLTAEVGYLIHFGTFAKAFYNANKALVVPNCSVCSTTAPTVIPTVSYCQNATVTALTATGTNLLWYTVATGGSSSAVAPVPNTTTVGTTTYYVSQTATGCEGPRASIIVTINAVPAMPTVTTPVNYAQSATATALTAIGTSIKWYSTLTGGTSLTTAPVPSTTVAGSTSYYVSQSTGTCESQRATITVDVSPVIIQTVKLKAGWNIIGCPISGTTALQSALSSIWSNVETIKNLDSFYSSTNIPAMNSLTTVQWGQGYLIKVTAPCTLDWIAQ